MSKSVLLTAATEDCEAFIQWADERDLDLIHLPLERYAEAENTAPVEETFAKLQLFETIVYGNKRNAIFFARQVKNRNLLKQVRERVNLTLDQHAAEYLEQEGIPAIRVFGQSKPIDLVEFMLRLRRTGPTLYPCGTHAKEEVPGLLEELDIPVRELELYTLAGTGPEELTSYRTALARQQPELLVFHSRRSVNRIRAAFPDLDYSNCAVISGDTAVSNKLRESGITADAEADGSWDSIIEALGQRL